MHSSELNSLFRDGHQVLIGDRLGESGSGKGQLNGYSNLFIIL